MSYDNLFASQEESLRKAMSERSRRELELHELESEAQRVRKLIGVLDDLIGQGRANLERLQADAIARSQRTLGVSDAELEAALARDAAVNRGPGPAPNNVHHLPGANLPYEAADSRFVDRTIPQATAMILRENGGALHVNDIYEKLKSGGFAFTGHNPTISIAVSLNRNRRFRKTAPGTFDLAMRDVAQAR
jgi:hypothetical protein